MPDVKSEWVGRYLSAPADLPVSFALGGKTITGIPDEWSVVPAERRETGGVKEMVFTGTDPATGLGVRVQCANYSDYPVVEWTTWLTNTGSEPTPVLSDVLALDGVLEGRAASLWHCNGDFCSAEGYTAEETPLPEGKSLGFAPREGRPCDRAFPYYRLMFEGRGVSLAIGWPGQWSVSFEGLSDEVRVRSGQEKTHMRLMPGETIRTPRITLMFWTGNGSDAVNLWRRWYRDYLLPRPDGKPLGPLLAAAATDEGEEFTAATEENQIRYMKKWAAREIPFDVWWIDAGWYPCFNKEGVRKWPETGTWEPDPERFPNGLKPVSDAAAGYDADLLLWFEPERVRPGTALDREHPEWLLNAEGNDNRLLFLGNPAAQEWLTDHVCGLIREHGIGIYRQDFNFEPLRHWRENEPDDRQGMNENLHVQGYLGYWDELLARNPGLWIDSCASGGRRNDLETLRRSVPLHYTDYGYGEHPVKLSFHHVLFEWIPYFKEVTLSWDEEGKSRYDRSVDRYGYHCGLGPMMMACLDIKRDDYDFETVVEMAGIWRRAAELMLRGDYYPLTPIHRTPTQWVARQFDLPEKGRGFIQGIRLPEAEEETLTVRPKAIEADAAYVFENLETGKSREMTGAALLADGFRFALPKRQGAAWFYRIA
jgi:alpha-galactosidase